jgi:hypothetical protein
VPRLIIGAYFKRTTFFIPNQAADRF